jgi:truncated hemoglobin YjbI
LEDVMRAGLPTRPPKRLGAAPLPGTPSSVAAAVVSGRPADECAGAGLAAPGEPEGEVVKPAGKNYTHLFSESYLKTVLHDPAGFFHRFYQLFREADPQVAALFSHTDMGRQVSLLEESLLYMLDFSRSRVASQRIEKLAARHGAGHIDVPARLFDVWLECLLATLRERDPELDSDAETAWRVTLAPGLAYMKSHCSSRPG